MYRYQITYDLESTWPQPYSAVIEQAASRGWSRWIMADGENCLLPNTTFVGNFFSRDAAENAFVSSVLAAEVEIGRSINVEAFHLVQINGGSLIKAKAKQALGLLAAALLRK